MQQHSTKLPQKVILLGWISFFADISSEMIYPLLPIFLTSIVGSPTIALGLIEGISQVIVSLLAVFSGVISDKLGNRLPFIRWGYGLPIFGKFLIGIATSWQLVFLGRSIDRFGKGLRGTPRDALIADAIDSARRGEAFGFHRTMDTAGALVGVIIAILVLFFLAHEPQETTFRIIFLTSSILAAASLAITFLLKESKVTPAATTLPDSKTRFSFLEVKKLGREYWITLSILSLFAFANSSDVFLLLRASDIGLSPLEVVIAYALYNGSYSGLSIYAGRLSDKFGRWHIIMTGWIIYALVYASMAITDSFFIWPIFAVYGLYMALTEGVSKALIVDCSPSGSRGAAIGMLYLALGISSLTSNLLAGYLWDNLSKAAPFWIGSGVAIIAVVAILITGRFKLRK